MNVSDLEKINIEYMVKQGIKPLEKAFSGKKIIGIDTETVQADLYSIQIDSKEKEYYIDVYDVYSEEDIVEILHLFFVGSNEYAVIYAHNLEYDGAFLFPSICEREKEGEVEEFGYKIKIFYPQPSFFKFVDQHTDRRMLFADTTKFYRMSLRKAGELLEIEKSKLESPEFLGERFPEDSEIEKFIQYAERDSYMARRVAEKGIVKMHREYDVSLDWTVSPASLSSKIFRKKFLKEEIPYPDCFSKYSLSRANLEADMSLVEMMALNSYYGGRTEAFAYGNAEVDVFDYSSHYPDAMCNIKVPVEKQWRSVDSIESPHGFYYIKATLPKANVMPFPVMDSRLTFPYGKVKGVVTGYEAEQIKKYGEIHDLEGVIYTGETSDCLQRYVKDFYLKKQEAKEDGRRRDYQFNKLMLNSLYGKFIQTREKGRKEYALVEGRGKEVNREFEAGGLFNPPVASWITGYARAKLFKDMRAEDENVCYCDTDSIMIKKQNNYDFEIGSGLGGLEKEAEGHGVFLREKLYFLMDASHKVKKAGLHGFWKNAKKLKEIVEKDKDYYKIEKMMKLRESKKQGLKPFTTHEQKRRIDFGGSNKRQNPSIENPMTEFERLDPLEYEMF